MDKEEIEVEENLKVLEELYNYSFTQLENRKNVKRHTEIKSLYLLQATAILLTLFSIIGLENSGVAFVVFKIIFYILIGWTVICLLFSLNDSLKDYNLKEVSNPNDVYNNMKNNKMDLVKYRMIMITSANECIERLSTLINDKNKLFNSAILGFTLSISAVLVMLFMRLI